jgi:cation diffusion facilitator family transporter
VTVCGLVLNLVLSATKFAVGAAASSQSLVADGVHSLSDTVTDLAIIVGAPLWTAPSDERHPYGHGRIETMVTFLIGLVLAAVGMGLGWRAVASVPTAVHRPPQWPALAVACLSILVKEGLYRWTAGVGRRLRSSALSANAWHHRSDALSSVPVVIAVVAVHLNPDLSFVDHVAAVIVSVLILHAAWTIIQPSFSQLVDAGATSQERERILAIAREVEGIHDVHALRTRHIGGGFQVDCHVLVAPDMTVAAGHRLAHSLRDRILDRFPDVVDVLVHVEPEGNPNPGSPSDES